MWQTRTALFVVWFQFFAPASVNSQAYPRRPERQLRIERLEERCLLAFSHPGLLFTDADFTRMAEQVAVSAQPWASGYNALVSDGYSQLGTAPRPLETVIRGGTGQNFNQMVIDMQRTYQLAVRWKVSGDVAYANQAVTYLNAWSSTMTTLTGNADRFLASGLYGFGWAAAADIMRNYSGWAPADVTTFQNYLLSIYVPMQRQFLTNHNDAYITNYWANWDLANIEGLMAIGIFTDRQDLYDEALAYLHSGAGNGSLDKMVYFMHPGNLAQWQESGRDQGHTILGMQLFGHIAQMAWQQGDDLFAYNNYQFLAAAEYIAKYNLGHDVPFETYNWGNGQNGAFSSQPGVSPAGRGDQDVGYELIVAHYVDRLGMAAPYSEQRIALRGTEWRGSGDDFGFGTLTYPLVPVTTGLAPKVTAREKGAGAVELNWYGTAGATGYNVSRATSASGPFTLIAANITDLLTYTDFNLPPGVYYYKVKGLTPTGETGDSNIVSATSTNLLHTLLPFDEATGLTAADATGNGHTGDLLNGAFWATGKTGSAVALAGANDFVSLPNGIVAGLNDFTISTWVYLNDSRTWSRIFDFGDERGRWMMLTPRNGNGVVEFATSTVYGYNKQWVVGAAALPTNQWVHVGVTLADRVGKLYVNGVAVGSNPGMDFAPFQFASTPRNWLGRSQYSSDPYLNGRIDDFRISEGALKAGEIYALATGAPAPAVPTAPASLTATAIPGNQINLSWPSVAGATAGYTVKRAFASAGPYTTLATRHTTTNFSDTGRTAGVTYYYVVTADNNGGESGNSPQAIATALPPLPASPTALSAQSNSATSILLTWSSAANAATYSVKRALTSGGPYAIIATGVATNSYTDPKLTTGTNYYYTVTAVNASGESAASNEAVAAVTDLSLWLKFDELTGTLADDSSDRNLNGALVNGPLFSAGRINNSLALDGANDHVTLPTGVLAGLTNITIATWVKLDSRSNWSRIFDFGSSTTTNMFLTPQNGATGAMRFAITTGGGAAEQRINTSTLLPLQTWSHVAVTLAGSVGVLYVNGVEVGRNNAMTLTPSSLGSTTLNYIGRSQYNDPYLAGVVDDFRILNRALTAGELVAMVNLPAVPGDFNRNSQVDAADYTVWRDALGTSAPAFSGADGDGNGFITTADYPIWATHFGQSAAGSNLIATATTAVSGVQVAARAPLLAPSATTSSRVSRLARQAALATDWAPQATPLLSRLRAPEHSDASCDSATYAEALAEFEPVKHPAQFGRSVRPPWGSFGHEVGRAH